LEVSRPKCSVEGLRILWFHRNETEIEPLKTTNFNPGHWSLLYCEQP